MQQQCCIFLLAKFELITHHIMSTKRFSIRKIILLSFALLVILVITAFLTADYYHYSKNKSKYRTLFIPRLEVGLFEVTNMSADKTTMNGSLLIHNPLPFGINVDSLEYKIYISNVEVIKSTYAKPLLVPKWNDASITMPVTVFNDKLVDILKASENQNKDSVVYRIETSFYARTFFKKKFDISVEKLLPLVYIPTATVKNISYKSLNGKGVTLFIKVNIGNRNIFPIKFKNLEYKFALANNPWIESKKTHVIDIKKQDSTELTLPLHVSFKEIFQSVGPLIRNGKNVDYKFELNMKLVSKSNVIKDSEVILKGEGTLKELIQLEKEEKKKAKAEKKMDKKDSSNK
jgi:LEA14-like dessication related protein